MAESFDDFEDAGDDPHTTPPLPPEDRLWRHPSEIASLDHEESIDPLAVRRKWLASEPSRASAWTAGVVGAVLATGLVLLGTHLATAFTAQPASSSDRPVNTAVTSSASIEPNSTTLIPALPDPAPASGGLGQTLRNRVEQVGDSIAVVQTTRSGATSWCLGLVIRSDGMLLVPQSAISKTSSLLVFLGEAQVPYVGSLVGTDPTSGLAVIHINTVNPLSSVHLDPNPTLADAMTLAITSGDGSRYVVGMMAGSGDTRIDQVSLPTLMTDIPTAESPLGSALVDANGNIIGIVTGANNGTAMATPSWLAGPVANELITSGQVTHGWLGIRAGQTKTNTTGVRVGNVAPKSAAAKAGLEAGDTISSINGHTVVSVAGLEGNLYILSPGTTVKIGVTRANRHMKVNAALDRSAPK